MKPFCWDEKAALRCIREVTDDGTYSRSAALAIYHTLNEVASDMGSDTFKKSQQSLAAHAGVSLSLFKEIMNLFRRVGLIDWQQNRREGSKELEFNTYTILAVAPSKPPRQPPGDQRSSVGGQPSSPRGQGSSEQRKSGSGEYMKNALEESENNPIKQEEMVAEDIKITMIANPPKGEIPERLCALYNRDPAKIWPQQALDAYSKLDIDTADLATVEAFHAIEWPKGKDARHRRFLHTLLPNWDKEVDRAREAQRSQLTNGNNCNNVDPDGADTKRHNGDDRWD